MPLQTSASEIANYRGNAAAALGSDPGAATIYGDTDASRVNTLLDTITANNVAKNIKIYDQKIRDRDAIFQKLASKEMTVDKLIPEDREVVRNKYLKPIRDLLLANPDIKSDPDKYLEFQNLTTDFEEQKTYGQHRYIMLTGMEQEIAKELDPEKRKRMQEHYDKTKAQGMLEPIKPYQQMLDYNDKTFTDVPATTSTKDAIVDDQVVTTTYTHTPLKDFTSGTTRNFIDSPNKTLMNEMNAFRTSFDAGTNEEKAKRILQWNAKIAEANAQEGYDQNHPDYVPPIKSKMKTDPNGEDHLIVEEPTTRVLLAESILRNYKNSSSANGKASALPSTIDKNRAATLKDLQTAKLLIPAQREAALAAAKNSRASAYKNMQEGKVAQGKVSGTAATGDFYTNSALHMMDSNAFKRYNLPRVEESQKLVGAAGSGLRGYLLKSNDFQGNSRSVLSDLEEKALSRRVPVMSADGKATGNYTIEKPTSIIFNDDDKRNPFFTTVYDDVGPTTKDPIYGMPVAGKASRSYETVKPIKLIENIIKGVVGETTSGKENVEFEATMQRIKERIGGGNTQNMNARMLELLEKNDWKEFTEPTSDLTPKPVPKKVPKKKVNSTLKKEADGLF